MTTLDGPTCPVQGTNHDTVDGPQDAQTPYQDGSGPVSGDIQRTALEQRPAATRRQGPHDRAQGDRTSSSDRTPPARRRRRGGNDLSAARVRSRLRADLALRLRGEGLTLEAVAAFPSEDGTPLYPGRRAAYEAVESARARRQKLAGRARLAIELRADGLTWTQIAAYPAPDGQPLYSSAERARQVVDVELERRRQVLAGEVPASSEDLVAIACGQLPSPNLPR